ncbi:unnamed protein product [Arabidopsis arenosa]|uniref:Uncharacterized protein n=1 Tax=Arabidopsis arenosa TaxID=38785 RepID=A0A8S2BA14_ARAAE|nr:unnamed protein product [Arabidopsis arenosa]
MDDSAFDSRGLFRMDRRRSHMRTHPHNPLEMGVLGSRGLLKKSEFIMLIGDALISLGLKGTANHLERATGVSAKLRNFFPSEFLVPERRLECLLERTLIIDRTYCDYHNVSDGDMSLYSDHHCGMHKIPSKTVQTLEEHTDEVWFLKFSHDGKYLASSSKDKSAIIWEMDAQEKFSEKHKLVGHEKPVVMVLWSPDDKQVATCGENEVIKRWAVESGEYIQSYERNGVGSVSCGWFHDGSGIIAGMTDRSICLWNLDGTEIVHEQGQGEQKLSDVAMTTDGKWLVSMGMKGEIVFVDRQTGGVGKKVVSEEDMITSFSLSEDNHYILLNLSTKKITLWFIDLDEPEEFHNVPETGLFIRSCFGGYNDSFIASGNEDRQVKKSLSIVYSKREMEKKMSDLSLFLQVYIWHRTKTLEPFTLRGHSGAVNCVSWNPINLHMLASASDDGTIRIWGLDTKLK